MKPKIIPYDPNLKELAKKLRKNSTLSEVVLWNALKARKMRGYSFNRQKPIDRYIVDFYCKELNLVIEIDGISHDFKIESDMKRHKKLESYGLTILRFNDRAVKNDLQNILLAVDGWIEDFEKSRRTN
jgi:very-short-patch-repair endonuclease